VATHFFKGAFDGLRLDSTEFDGADFSASTVPHYQMVPHRGTRQLQLRVTPGAPNDRFRLGMSVQGIFEIELLPPSQPFPPGVNFIEVNANAEQTIDISIHGALPGRAFLLAEDMNGTPIDSVQIAVKKQRRVTFNLFILEDSFHTATTPFLALQEIMTLFRKIWLRQANVDLAIARGGAPLIFDLVSFGNPLHLHESPIPHSPFDRDNVFDKIQQRLAKDGFKSQDINLIATWNQKSKPGTFTSGDTPGNSKTCHVVGLGKTSTEATVYAHEIGHALGLQHDGHIGDHMMHEGRRDSFLLTRNDIDAVNK